MSREKVEVANRVVIFEPTHPSRCQPASDTCAHATSGAIPLVHTDRGELLPQVAQTRGGEGSTRHQE